MAPALITPSQCADLLGIPESPRLTLLVQVASDQLASLVGYPLHYRTETVSCYSPGGSYIWTAHGLLKSIESIELNGKPVPSAYVIENPRLGKIRNPHGYWPKTAIHSGSPTPTAIIRDDRIKLTGTFGFVTPSQATEELPADVPLDVQLAVALLAQVAMAATVAPGISAQSLGGASLTFSSDRLTGAVPAQVQRVVDFYQGSKRWVP